MTRNVKGNSKDFGIIRLLCDSFLFLLSLLRISKIAKQLNKSLILGVWFFSNLGMQKNNYNHFAGSICYHFLLVPKLGKEHLDKLCPRSHGLVVRATTCEARGPVFDSSSDQMFFFSPPVYGGRNKMDPDRSKTFCAQLTSRTFLLLNLLSKPFNYEVD